MTSPFASARVTVKTFMKDGGSPPSDPPVLSPWAGRLMRFATVAVDDNWLRLLAAGGHGLPPLHTPAPTSPAPTSPAPPSPTPTSPAPTSPAPTSAAPTPPAPNIPDAPPPPADGPGLPNPAAAARLLVGFDVLGGSFAVGEAGVEYFTPDGLEWIPLGLTGLDDLVDWALAGGLADAFGELRWPGWQAEIRFLAPDQGVSVYPPLWSEQGQDIAAGTRGVTPLLELVAAHHDAAGQLAGVDDGEDVHLNVTD